MIVGSCREWNAVSFVPQHDAVMFSMSNLELGECLRVKIGYCLGHIEPNQLAQKCQHAQHTPHVLVVECICKTYIDSVRDGIGEGPRCAYPSVG